MIEQGGVKIDGQRVSDRSLTIAKGVVVVAQVGKRKFARVSVK
jgi:tyrosyl-tRNA synthetase